MSKNAVQNFIKKYKLVSASVLGTSIISAELFYSGNNQGNWFEKLYIFFFAAMGAYLVDKIFEVYDYVIVNKIKEKINTDSSNIIKYKNIIKTFFM